MNPRVLNSVPLAQTPTGSLSAVPGQASLSAVSKSCDTAAGEPATTADSDLSQQTRICHSRLGSVTAEATIVVQKAYRACYAAKRRIDRLAQLEGSNKQTKHSKYDVHTVGDGYTGEGLGPAMSSTGIRAKAMLRLRRTNAVKERERQNTKHQRGRERRAQGQRQALLAL
jgi:hypothetical protein